MIQIPANIESIAWLVEIQYPTPGSVAVWRWTDSDEQVVTPSNGTFEPHGPILDVSGVNVAGARLERREWTITLSDSDPLNFYKRTFRNRWRRREAKLYSWIVQTDDDDPVLRLWKVGVMVNRQFVLNENGRQARLIYGAAIERNSGTRMRYVNPQAQRAVEETDDSLDGAQSTLDINWGGNA